MIRPGRAELAGRKGGGSDSEPEIGQQKLSDSPLPFGAQRSRPGLPTPGTEPQTSSGGQRLSVTSA
eukprot:Skav234934  [mRNA]  locus=scaffold2677:127617:132607:+ [translate_table: standard]